MPVHAGACESHTNACWSPRQSPYCASALKLRSNAPAVTSICSHICASCWQMLVDAYGCGQVVNISQGQLTPCGMICACVRIYPHLLASVSRFRSADSVQQISKTHYFIHYPTSPRNTNPGFACAFIDISQAGGIWAGLPAHR